MPDSNVSTITVDHRVVDGWHVFASADIRGLYVANEDQQAAFDAVGPTVETLLRLNEDVRVKVRPATSFSCFLQQLRGKALQSPSHPISSQFVVFAGDN